MIILKKKLYKIDAANEILEPNQEEISDDFDTYILSEINTIQSNYNTYKKYKEDEYNLSTVIAKSNEMFSFLTDENIIELANNEEDYEITDTFFDFIANKLYLSEIQTQAEMNLDIKIKKGTILFALILNEREVSFLVIKFEHEGIYGGETFSHITGVPDSEKNLQLKLSYIKALQIEEGQLLIEDMLISEKKNSKYWPQYFMQLVPMSTNEKDTSDAITVLNRIMKKIKSDFPEDYPALYSNYISYLSSNERFVYNDFKEMVFSRYTESNPHSDFNSTEYTSTLEDKIENNKLQGEFEIVPDIVTKKLIRHAYQVNSFFKLSRIKTDSNDPLNSDIICLKAARGNTDYILELKIDESNVQSFSEYDYDKILITED